MDNVILVVVEGFDSRTSSQCWTGVPVPERDFRRKWNRYLDGEADRSKMLRWVNHIMQESTIDARRVVGGDYERFREECIASLEGEGHLVTRERVIYC